MQDQQFTCVDCGKRSPPTPEGETITKQHGWRITRRELVGVLVIEPRCPQCAARHRTLLPPTMGRRGR